VNYFNKLTVFPESNDIQITSIRTENKYDKPKSKKNIISNKLRQSHDSKAAVIAVGNKI
jgi:hypothetical protein